MPQPVDKNFDIVAAFNDPGSAQRVAQDLERRGVPKRHLHLVRPSENDPARVAEMRGEMQEEVTEGFAGPGIGFATPAQTKGAAIGTAIGTAVGVALGLAIGAFWAFAVDSAISQTGRLAIAAVCFGLGGSAAGFIAGGALKPRSESKKRPSGMLDAKRLAGERNVLLEVHVTDEDEARMVTDVLEHAGAARVDAIDNEGTPLPPQHEHPRPADPPSYWQGNGRKHA